MLTQHIREWQGRAKTNGIESGRIIGDGIEDEHIVRQQGLVYMQM